jgi:hypothetical protein
MAHKHEKHAAERRDAPRDLVPDAEEDVERSDVDALSEEEEPSGTALGDHRSFFDNDIPLGDEPLR